MLSHGSLEPGLEIFVKLAFSGIKEWSERLKNLGIGFPGAHSAGLCQQQDWGGDEGALGSSAGQNSAWDLCCFTIT